METTGIEIWNRHYLKPESLQSYPDEALVRLVRSLSAPTDEAGPKSAAGAERSFQQDAKREMPDTTSDSGQESRQTCLDFGCGSGRHVPFLQDSGYHVIGCDGSENAVAHCSRTYNGAQFFISRDLEFPSAPFSSGKYDLIICWGVLHYLEPDRAKTLLQEFGSALKPGGHLIGTLRKDTDTQFRRSAVSGTPIHLADERALNSLLSGTFREYSYGFMERSLLGDLDAIVAHWYFRARRNA